MSCVYRRTNSSRLRNKLRRLQESPLSSHLDRGSTEDSNSSSDIFSSSVEARLWFLTQSKLFDPFACRGLKSLNTSNKTSLGSQEMLDESLDDAEDVMLDGNEVRILDGYGDAMELDEANHVDLFHEHSLDGIADEGEEPWDNNLFRKHSQDEVSYNRGENLDNDTTSSVNNEFSAKLYRAS